MAISPEQIKAAARVNRPTAKAASNYLDDRRGKQQGWQRIGRAWLCCGEVDELHEAVLHEEQGSDNSKQAKNGGRPLIERLHLFLSCYFCLAGRVNPTAHPGIGQQAYGLSGMFGPTSAL